jgi:hypothetical protein
MTFYVQVRFCIPSAIALQTGRQPTMTSPHLYFKIVHSNQNPITGSNSRRRVTLHSCVSHRMKHIRAIQSPKSMQQPKSLPSCMPRRLHAWTTSRNRDGVKQNIDPNANSRPSSPAPVSSSPSSNPVYLSDILVGIKCAWDTIVDGSGRIRSGLRAW